MDVEPPQRPAEPLHGGTEPPPWWGPPPRPAPPPPRPSGPPSHVAPGPSPQASPQASPPSPSPSPPPAVKGSRPKRKGLWAVALGTAALLIAGLAFGAAHLAQSRPSSQEATGIQPNPAVATHAASVAWSGLMTGIAVADPTIMGEYADRGVVNVVVAKFSCGCPAWPSRPRSVETTAPVEHSYPTTFFAELDFANYEHGPLSAYAELEHKSPTARWKFAYLSVATGPVYLHPTTTASMEDDPVPVAYNLRQNFQLFAQYLQEVRTAGAAVGNPWNVLTGGNSEAGVLGSQLVQAHAADVAAGVTVQVAYRVARVGTVFATPQGDAACAEIDSFGVETAGPGSRLFQPSDRSTYGSLLPPGTYSSVTIETARDVCLQGSANGGGAMGLVGGMYHVTGTARQPLAPPTLS